MRICVMGEHVLWVDMSYERLCLTAEHALQ